MGDIYIPKYKEIDIFRTQDRLETVKIKFENGKALFNVN